MRGATLQRFFLVLFVLLPAQFGAAKLCEHLYGIEIWPAVLAPSFARVYDSDGDFEVPHPEVAVAFADSSRARVPVSQLLGQLPGSHRRSVMRSQFAHDYGLAPGAPPAPATVQWAADRLRTLYPDRTPRCLTVRWVRSYYRRDGDALRPVREVAFDSVLAELPAAARPSRPPAPR